MEGSGPSKRGVPHSDFGLHDARVAPQHSPVPHITLLFVAASLKLRNFWPAPSPQRPTDGDRLSACSRCGPVPSGRQHLADRMALGDCGGSTRYLRWVADRERKANASSWLSTQREDWLLRMRFHAIVAKSRTANGKPCTRYLFPSRWGS